MKKLATGIAALVLAIAPAALANSFNDPDDMTSPLDVRELKHKDLGNEVHVLRVTTDDNWPCRYFDPSFNKMKWYFDGRGDNRVDLIGRVKCLKAGNERDLVLFLHGPRTGNQYEPIPLQKPTRHTIRARFTFDIPELNGEHVDTFIKVQDGMAEGCTSANPCTERAPDDGRWRLY